MIVAVDVRGSQKVVNEVALQQADAIVEKVDAMPDVDIEMSRTVRGAVYLIERVAADLEAQGDRLDEIDQRDRLGEGRDDA